MGENTAKVMNAAGVDFTILGDQEFCCGNPYFVAGGFENGKELAMHNLRVLKELGVKTVVFNCPGCHRAFADEYPHLLGKEAVAEFREEYPYVAPPEEPEEEIMTKESLYGFSKDNLIFKETLNSETDSVRNGCEATAVSYANGVGTFDGVDSKLDCGNDFIGTKAITIVMRIKLASYGEGSAGRLISNGITRLAATDTSDRLAFVSDGSTAAFSAVVMV